MMLLPLLLQILFLALVTSDGRYLVILGERRREYVWHCHILGHEENDMMRPIVFKVPPEAPSNLVATANGSSVNLTWTDNSASETGFTLQRATDAAFATAQPLATVSPLNPDANGQGITWGGTVSYTDQSPSSPAFY